MEIESYLRSKGFKLHQAPGQWQFPCPFCGDKNKRGHLYLNREHGAWMCHRCDERGSFYSLQERLGDNPSPASRAYAHKQEVWEVMVELCEEALQDHPESLAYLREERGLKAATIEKYRIGYVPSDIMDKMLSKFELSELKNAGLVTDENYPLFWDRILIPYFHQGRITTLRAKQVGGNVIQAKDTNIYLFGADNVRGHQESYICEGEFDAVFLDQLGFAACAIPGAASFQERWVTYFDDSRRVFLCLDADDAGRKGAHKIEQYIGARAKKIELPVPNNEDSTDITEFFLRDLNTKGDFEALVESVRGRRLYTFEDGVEERDEMLKLEGVKLGWKELDYAIEPGLLPGQVAIVLAKTGIGKTAFLTQVAHNLSSWESYDGKESGPGIPSMFLSLEQTKGEITERLIRTSMLYNPWATVQDIGKWHKRVRICDENRIPPADVPLLIEEYIDDIGEPPRLVFVDYLGYWSRAFKGSSKYEQTSEAIMELKRLAKQYEFAVIAPHQVSRLQKRGDKLDLDNARDSGVVEETADFVFGLYRPYENDPDDWRRSAEIRLEILKSRHGNTGKTVPMVWAPYSLAMVAPGTQAIDRTEKEWVMRGMQHSYDEVLSVHQGKFPVGAKKDEVLI